MPVFVYEPDAFQRLCALEAAFCPPAAEEYPRDATLERFGDCSFEAFRLAWEKAREKGLHEHPQASESTISVGGNNAIYGYWGWTRYVVYLSGEIAFIAVMSPDPAWVDIAKTHGFRIT
jgi:hypothetical protein